MSARSIALPAVILLLAAAGLVAAGRVGLQALPSHTLLGTVTDPGGRPLQSATVELSLPATTGSVHIVTTGTDGAYRFERIVPGLYVLTVRLPGFGSAIRDLEIGDGADEFRFDVQLEPSSRENAVIVPPAGPDRRVVCGLTMITPSNIDPKIVVPGNRPPQSMPFNDRTIPVPPATPRAPQSTVKPTMRIAQPTMCWDPMPALAR
jgi:hypothetical protein